MSGHSKWSTIKRKKGAADQKRGKIFTRCIHELTVAVKEGGGGDPSNNPRLRFAIDKARAVNMPTENIERAIRRATGEEKGAETVEALYEGYGPGGVAVLVEALTDNRNRTVSDVRHAFSKVGGALGESGCVNWMFEKKGVLCVAKDYYAEDQIMEIALEGGADDVTPAEEVWVITCDPKALPELRQAFSDANVNLESAELQLVPKTRVALGEKESEQMNRLLETLDDLDDVMSVATNWDSM